MAALEHIAAVEWAPLQVPLHTPFAIASETTTVTANWWVRVQLSDGTEGWGEAAPAPTLTGETVTTVEAALRDVRDLLQGQPAAWRPGVRVLRTHLSAHPAACAAVEVRPLGCLDQAPSPPPQRVVGGCRDGAGN